MHYVNRLLHYRGNAADNGFAVELAAFGSLCFAGYLGLLVF